jgi:hypothetical protein
LDDLPPGFLVLLSEQLPAEVLDVHLRDVHTLVHDDLALRWSGRKIVTLMMEKSKRPFLKEKKTSIGDNQSRLTLIAGYSPGVCFTFRMRAGPADYVANCGTASMVLR